MDLIRLFVFQIITHMTFSIVGSVFSGVMFAMGVFGARNGYFVVRVAFIRTPYRIKYIKVFKLQRYVNEILHSLYNFQNCHETYR